MKILLINEVCGHTSTGKICTEIACKFENDGHEVKIAFGRDGFVPDKYKKYAVRIGNDWDVNCHALLTRLTDRHGLGSRTATKRFLNWADEFRPNMIWIHNLHGYYINYEFLFDWIKKHPDIDVKWTLHDCWAFTGHCSHFTYAKCERWKTGCYDCPQRKEYPTSILIDNCKDNFDRKYKAFRGVRSLTIITPSNWMKEKVCESFLSVYPIEVQHNTIDKSVFKPTPSDFRKKYGLEDKTIILGVANVWNERKGLNDFIQLASMLGNNYAIVLVGLTQKQIKEIPRRITGLSKTSNQNELVKIYTSADISSKSSREKVFGMEPVKVAVCGTKKMVYSDTVCEEISKENEGYVVDQGVENLYEAITGQKFGKGSGIHNVYKLVCIPKTNNAYELVKIYSASDLFVNPTYEDTYPTVNLEAKACGTKVIAYNTGGTKETIVRERLL